MQLGVGYRYNLNSRVSCKVERHHLESYKESAFLHPPWRFLAQFPSGEGWEIWKLTHCALMNSICKLKVFSETCSACYQVHCCFSKTKCPLSLSPDYNLRGELSHGISQSLYSPSPCDPNVGLTRTYGMTLLIKPLGSALRAKVAPLPGDPYCSASGSWRKLSVHPCAVACGSWRAGWKVWERRACYVCRVMKPNSFNANKKKEKVWGKRESSYPWPSEEMWAQGSHAIALLMFWSIHSTDTFFPGLLQSGTSDSEWMGRK